MHLNDSGNIIQNEWDRSFVIRRELIRDEFVVMPNHFHGIVRLISIPRVCVPVPVETSGRTSLQQPPRLQPKSVSSFMAGVKSIITKRINGIRNTPGASVLQYRFHDHVIRNDHELYRIRQYIKNNPFNWNHDKLKDNKGNVVMEPAAIYGEEPWMV
jgi:REP element-mobilizing transposase RayT